MASSRKSLSSDLAACVADAIRAHVPAGARLTLGLSGGVDSVVLLDALAALAPTVELRLDCVHVHHGLSPDADRWAAFCRELGRRYGVPVAIERVKVDPASGLGVEAAARAARYAVLRASAGEIVALAHHRDDQAETVLLQLVRGAGLGGLAGMPVWQPGTPAFLRPLLAVDRATIESHARHRGLAWVDDASNDDPRYARNFVRHRIMPLLAQVNPAAAANLARSAGHLAEAQSLLRALGQADLAASAPAGRLRVAALAALGPARARNTLRVWLEAEGLAPPSSRRLEALLRQLIEAREDGNVRVELDALSARRFRGELWLVADPPPTPPDFTAVWQGARPWAIPELRGVLSFEPTRGEGLDAALVVAGALVVRARRGGERLRIGPGRPSRSLKNLFQESAVPPWERAAVPLVYAQGRLACVPGIGVDPDRAAGVGAAGIRLRWTPFRTAKPVIK